MNNKKIYRFLNAAIVLGILSVALVFIISVWQTKKVKQNFERAQRSLSIKNELQSLQIKAIKVQSTTRGYVITNHREYVDSFPIAGPYFKQHLAVLRSLVPTDMPSGLIDSLELNIQKRMNLTARIIAAMDEGNKAEAEKIVGSEIGKMINFKILSFGQQLEKNEEEFLKQYEEVSRKQIGFLNAILYSGISIFLLMTIFFMVVIWRNIHLDKKSRELIGELVGAGPDGMVILDNEGHIVNMNSRGEKMFGYHQDEISGKALDKLFPVSKEEFESFMLAKDADQYFSSGREVSAIRKDGSVFFAEIYIAPLFGRKEFAMAVSIRDISKRKTAHKQLEMLSRQINVSNDAIYIVDKNRKISSWNSGAEKLYGYQKEEVLGCDPFDVFKIDASNPAVRKIRELLQKNQHWSGENVEQTKIGKTIYTFTSITLIHDEIGMLEGYISVSYNITDQRILRQELNYHASIVEQTSDAILSTEMDGNIISWNRGAEILFGYTKLEAIGKTARQLGMVRFTEEEVAKIYDELKLERKWHAEKMYHHKNGTDFFGEVTGNILVDESGTPVSRVYIVKDISRRKQLEDQLRQSNEQLEQRVRLRTEEISRTEKRYRNLFENNPLPMLIMDIHSTQYIDVNKMAVLKYGYSREEFLQLKATDLRPASSRESFTNSLNELINSTTINKGVWTHLKKNGETFPVEIIAHPIRIDLLEASLILANDITDRKIAEEKLEASEKRFRALIENNYDIISLMDKDFNVFYRSPSAARFTGWTDEEMVGVNGASKVHPDDRVATKKIIGEIMENPGKPMPTRFRQQHKDGHYLWVEGIVVNWLHVEAVSAIVFNFRDVTEKVLAEEKLLANEKRYRDTLDQMIEGVQIVGFDWKYIYANDSLSKQAGITKDAIIGKSLLELFPQLANTDLYFAFERCFSERVSVHLESNFIYPNGASVWFEISVQPVPEGVFVLTVDITKRKKAEAKLNEERQLLRTLSDNLPGLIIFQFVCGKEIEGRFTYISKEAANLTGHGASEIIIDANLFFKRVAKNDVQKLFVSIEEAANKETTVLKEIIFYSVKDGTRCLKFVANPRRAKNDKLLLDGFYIDITEQKRAERKIIQMNEELEQLVEKRTVQLTKTNEELEAFSYSVSHDLRAPLRIINGFTEIFEEEYASKLDDEAKRLTHIIKQNTQRMGQLIDDLLAFFRMGRHEIKKVVFDTDEIFKEVMDNSEKIAGCVIEWKVGSLLPSYGDYITLRQVWINLISNAIKYSSMHDQPVIEIGSYHKDNEVVYFVKDNGVGFDQKYADKLFKVFQRLHANQNFEGTGVGLAIVHKIISKHSGRVWASGKQGEGATFYFSLPDRFEFVDHIPEFSEQV